MYRPSSMSNIKTSWWYHNFAFKYSLLYIDDVIISVFVYSFWIWWCHNLCVCMQLVTWVVQRFSCLALMMSWFVCLYAACAFYDITILVFVHSLWRGLYSTSHVWHWWCHNLCVCMQLVMWVVQRFSCLALMMSQFVCLYAACDVGCTALLMSGVDDVMICVFVYSLCIWWHHNLCVCTQLVTWVVQRFSCLVLMMSWFVCLYTACAFDDITICVFVHSLWRGLYSASHVWRWWGRIPDEHQQHWLPHTVTMETVVRWWQYHYIHKGKLSKFIFCRLCIT